MNWRILLTAGTALLISGSAFAAEEATAPAPQAGEQAAGSTSPAPADPYAELNRQVQEKLKALGFYSGPVNGDFGFYTQAALAQFQLSVPLPASGSLDERTLAALGIAAS